MEENNLADFEISQEEWEKEIVELAAKSNEIDIHVRVWWLFGQLDAIAFQPLVSDKTLHIYLQRQPASDLCNGHIQISLPKPYQGQFLKHTSESGDVLLTMRYPIGKPPRVLDYVDVQLATNPDMLQLVTDEIPKPTVN